LEGWVITGVGVDAVPIERMRLALDRTPRLAERVFTQEELETAGRRASREASLAARFAAKEACRKALRSSVPWRAIEVRSARDGSPTLWVAGHDDQRFEVSLTHTSDLAIAVVVTHRS
jgi:holo-[acyl-carrier protein] synthase